jgi:8-amino-7-oxononanoate synthase
MTWAQWTQDELDALRMLKRRRRIVPFDGAGTRGLVGNRSVTSFASNDYLGLSIHPSVKAAGAAAIERFGTGAGASRLVTGTCPLHEELESEIALWQQSDSALVFPTGYAANLAVLSVFGAADVTIFSDALNHASIVDGCRLSKSKSKVCIYRHCDVDHLATLLAATRGRKLIVTDVVFSMDGDVAPIAAIGELCRVHDALLVLDEAHAVMEPVHAPDCEILHIGTLSKTLASLGGWVAGSRTMIDLLINCARSFIFTTALPPSAVATALQALRIVRTVEGEELRSQLREHIGKLSPNHRSPIVPLIFGSEDRAQQASARLLELGFHIPAIRPPSVPVGTSRLRIALSAAHEPGMVNRLQQELNNLLCPHALAS